MGKDLIAHASIKKINKIILISLFIIMTNSAAIAKDEWKILSRESGCEPLESIYDDFEYLLNAKTPNQIFDKIKRKFPDTQLIPIITVVLLERLESKEPPTKQELTFFKDFTKFNALQIKSEKAGIELNIITNNLCLKLASIKPES